MDHISAKTISIFVYNIYIYIYIYIYIQSNLTEEFHNSIHMKFSMTGQEKGDLLIQVTA
jgi:hypothetical protein